MTDKQSFVIVLVFTVSLLSTYLMRLHALRTSLLDIPNERSSHSIPTPRGGGLAIALSFFGGIGILAWQQSIPDHLALALISGGSIIALIGLLDDRYQLAIYWRLAAQIIGAAIALYYLDMGALSLFKDGIIVLHGFHQLILLLVIVWFINLYNFMDGIDALAGSEAMFVSLAAGILLCGVGTANICWVLAAAVAGFLIWNWPPAKIFMGDVSSGLLGFIFAILGVYAASQHQLPLITWFILLAVFLVDASCTLIRRFWAGERWYAPHRSHAYQRLVQHSKGHRQITLKIIAFNLVVLFPLAALSTIELPWSLAAGFAALLLCTLIWFKIISKYPLT